MTRPLKKIMGDPGVRHHVLQPIDPPDQAGCSALFMDVTSLLLPEWFLWLRGGLAAVGGYLLCRRRNYAAVIVALLVAYWAYNSISMMVDFRTELLEQLGLSYMVLAYVGLLVPFACMGLGLLLRRKHADRPGAAANGNPEAPVRNSRV